MGAEARVEQVAEVPSTNGRRPHPFLLVFGLLFLLLPIWHAFTGMWTDHRHIAAGLLVCPTVGALLLRLRLVKRGTVPPAEKSGSRLIYLLAVLWASGPALLAGDRWLYGGSVFRDVLGFIGSSLICWMVALGLFGSTQRGKDAEPESPPRRLNVPATVALVVLLIVFVNVYPIGEAAPATARVATPAPHVPQRSVTVSSAPAVTTVAVVMPDLVGRPLPDAERSLLAVATDVTPTHLDRSPLNRDVWMKDNWTVVETVPGAGAAVAPGSKAEMFLLKNSEAAWFTRHPVMPKVETDADALDLSGPGRPLEGISELVELRYARNKTPADARNRNEDLGWEPAGEKAARAGLKQAYTGLVVGSIPAAKQKLRVGQLVVVTVRDKPDSPSSGGSGSVTSRPDDNDGDDDFNVPGWLCPTRFC